jgi:hypothetical protein
MLVNQLDLRTQLEGLENLLDDTLPFPSNTDKAKQ